MDISAAAIFKFANLPISPHFDKPFLSASVGEFWSKRWNLTVGNTLRSLVYDPIHEGGTATQDFWLTFQIIEVSLIFTTASSCSISLLNINDVIVVVFVVRETDEMQTLIMVIRTSNMWGGSCAWQSNPHYLENTHKQPQSIVFDSTRLENRVCVMWVNYHLKIMCTWVMPGRDC